MSETRFKETEVGLIPEDWKVVKLGDYANNFTGLTYSPEDVHSYGTLVLRSSNILNGELNFSDCVYVTCKIPERAVAHNGDILICVRNGSSRLIGKSAMICTNDKMAFGAFMTVLRATDKISNYYLNYYWQSPLLQSQINDNKGNIINQITGADINRYLLVLPPSEEQELIGNVFKKMDELISGIKELIEKKRSIKDGAMSELLTGRKRLPEFNEPWVTLKLEDLGEFFKGKGISRSESNSGNIPAIRYGEIYTYHNNYIREFKSFISRDVSDHSFPLIKGDICFAGSGETLEDIGKAVAFIDDYEAYAGGDIVVLRPNNNVCSLFIGFLLNTNPVRQQKANKGNGVSIMHISATGLAGIEVTFPSNIEEQQAIADILTSMDSEIEALENKLHKYEQIKQGMMQQLLTGKIRLI